jgi:hypothetical protein
VHRLDFRGLLAEILSQIRCQKSWENVVALRHSRPVKFKQTISLGIRHVMVVILLAIENSCWVLKFVAYCGIRLNLDCVFPASDTLSFDFRGRRYVADPRET